MPAKFKPKGPFSVPYTQKARVQRIEKEDVAQFWQKHSILAQEKGCYAFTIRVKKGVLPYYVGKATKNFLQEIFTRDKLDKYNSALAEYPFSVGPEMFVLSYEKDGRGRDNRAAIGELEKTLTSWAKLRNPKLKNLKNTNLDEEFEILGVKSRGARSKELKYLNAVFGL
jgi:hypothetical protein